QDQAARHLGWSVSTVKRRLDRARELLRERLVRRGLGPAGVLAALAFPLAHPAPALAAATVRAALPGSAAHAAAVGVVSPRVATPTGGVVKTVFLTKKTVALVLVLLVGALTLSYAIGRAVSVPTDEKTVVPVGPPAGRPVPLKTVGPKVAARGSGERSAAD